MQNNYVPEFRISQNILMNIWESISAFTYLIINTYLFQKVPEVLFHTISLMQ